MLNPLSQSDQATTTLLPSCHEPAFFVSCPKKHTARRRQLGGSHSQEVSVSLSRAPALAIGCDGSTDGGQTAPAVLRCSRQCPRQGLELRGTASPQLSAVPNPLSPPLTNTEHHTVVKPSPVGLACTLEKKKTLSASQFIQDKESLPSARDIAVGCCPQKALSPTTPGGPALPCM